MVRLARTGGRARARALGDDLVLEYGERLSTLRVARGGFVAPDASIVRVPTRSPRPAVKVPGAGEGLSATMAKPSCSTPRVRAQILCCRPARGEADSEGLPVAYSWT